MTLETLDLDHLSASSISTWLDSPLRWKKHYIEKVKDGYGFSLHRGIVLHDVLERYWNHVLSGVPLGVPVDEAIPAWVRSSWSHLKAESNGAFDDSDDDRDRLSTLIVDYLSTVGLEIKPITVEAPFVIDLPYAEKLKKLVGRMDMVAHVNDRVTVIDFKTSQRRKSIADVRHDPQRIIYGLAMREQGIKGDIPFRYDQFIFKKEPEIDILEVIVTEQEMDTFATEFLPPLIKTIEWSVENDCFYYNPNARYGTGL